MGISIILLAYNEADSLSVLLPEINKKVSECVTDYELLVIDTAEPMDNTRDVCEQYGAAYINQEEPFFGGAFRTGIRYAKYDMILFMDSDGAHDPKYIPDIYNMFIQGADVTIGSRYVKGGITFDSKISRLMSWLLNITYRLFLGIKAKDISTNFRMYHTYDIKGIVLTCKNYDILQEILLKLKIKKPELIITETPITLEKRIHGVTKRRLLPFILSYIKTLFKLTFLRLFNLKVKEHITQYSVFFYLLLLYPFFFRLGPC